MNRDMKLSSMFKSAHQDRLLMLLWIQAPAICGSFQEYVKFVEKIRLQSLDMMKESLITIDSLMWWKHSIMEEALFMDILGSMKFVYIKIRVFHHILF